MYDALLDSVERAKQISTIIDRLNLEPHRYLLATVHRAENTDQRQRLKSIVGAFVALAKAGHTVVFPTHPRTSKQLAKLSIERCERFLRIDPVPFTDMMALESMARVILTDSGGVQKEACWLKVPCVTLRDDTEWTETVDSGWNRLVGADEQLIIQAVDEAKPGAQTEWPWKRGEASRNVAQLIEQRRVC
jgi:UDP-N-acetylglucosamine 2-epimerase (non-hydrolysing)